MSKKATDPKMKKSLRCALPGCDEPLTEVAIANGDPFHSTVCCKEWHGVEITQPGQGKTVGSSS